MVAFTSTSGASYWREVQQQMATSGSYSVGGYVGKVSDVLAGTYTSDNTAAFTTRPTSPASTFKSGTGYIPWAHVIETRCDTDGSGWPTYTYKTSSPIVNGAEKREDKSVADIGNIPSYPGDSIAESLFVINPKLRKQYKGDKRQLQADIMFAATHQLQKNAASKLARLLGGEK